MPPFYSSGNFRSTFNAQFTRNARDAKCLLSRKRSIEALSLPRKNEPEINHHTTLLFTIDNHNGIERGGENHAFKSNAQLTPAFFQLNPDRLPDYQPSVAAFYKILFASIHLIANGNVFIGRYSLFFYPIKFVSSNINIILDSFLKGAVG